MKNGRKRALMHRVMLFATTEPKQDFRNVIFNETKCQRQNSKIGGLTKHLFLRMLLLD
jgi:hypothetical protein